MSSWTNSHQEIISKSQLIQSGCPAVYQLNSKTKELELMTRVTYGTKNVNKINKTILLVGETGAGKSTLIDTMVNYAMGVKFEDDVWFQIVEEEEEERSQAESQTSDVIVYEIFGFEDKTLPYSLTIIDTPGFGDTRGIEKDTIVSHRLFDLFRSANGVHEINAVCVVMKATDNRVNDRLSYVLNSVMSLFGKNMEKNIVTLFTHSDGRRPKNALEALKKTKLKCARNDKNEPVYFLFDNSQTEERTEEIEFLKVAVDISEKGMRELAAFLEKIEPKRMMLSKDVLKERISLTASIQNLLQRIDVIEKKQGQIRQIQQAVKKHEEEMRKNEKFTVEIEQVFRVKEPIKTGKWLKRNFFEKALVCPVCEENCHYPGCSFILSPRYCEVFKKDRCTVCTGKCPPSAHVKENWTYVTKTRKVLWTLKDMEDRYKRHRAEGEKKFSLLKSLERQMNELLTEKSQLVDEAYQHVLRLEEIALKADSVSTFIYLDFLIKKMEEKGDREKIQRLKEIESRMDEGTKLALQYMWGKISGSD